MTYLGCLSRWCSSCGAIVPVTRWSGPDDRCVFCDARGLTYDEAEAREIREVNAAWGARVARCGTPIRSDQ